MVYHRNVDQTVLPMRKRKRQRLNYHQVLYTLIFLTVKCLSLKDFKLSGFSGNMYSCVECINLTCRFYYFSIFNPRQFDSVFSFYFFPLERLQHCNFLLLSDLEKKCVISDELCAIFWEFLHWHIFWTERICSPSSYSWAFNRLQMWRSIARLKYDLQLHLIHFPPFHEIEMDGWAN